MSEKSNGNQKQAKKRKQPAAPPRQRITRPRKPDVQVQTPPLASRSVIEEARSKRKGKIAVLEQWVEVRIEEGCTITRLYPSNTQLTKEKKRMKPEPMFVYRRFHFPDGIPAEYAWTFPANVERLAFGGCGIQRMTTEIWEEVIQREAHNVGKHVGPTGVGNLPRPKERGGCSCPVCSASLDDGDEEGSDSLQQLVPEPGSACLPKQE